MRVEPYSPRGWAASFTNQSPGACICIGTCLSVRGVGFIFQVRCESVAVLGASRDEKDLAGRRSTKAAMPCR